MKRILSLTLILISTLTIFSGCNNTNETMDIAKNLDNNLNKLSSIVTRLDTIDTNYIANPDISSSNILSVPNKNNSSKTFILAFNNQTEEENQSLLNSTIIKEMQDVYMNKDGNCLYCNEEYCCDEEGYCNSCKQSVLCDENGSCIYCLNPLEIDENFNCKNCNTYTLLEKKINTEILDEIEDNNTETNETEITNIEQTETETNSTTQEEISVPTEDNLINETIAEISAETNTETTSTVETDKNTGYVEPISSYEEITYNIADSNDSEPKNTITNDTTETISTEDITTEEEAKIIKNEDVVSNSNIETPADENNTINDTPLPDNSPIVDTREDNSSNTKFYYYTRESFEPIQLRYKPRYVNEYNETNINDQLSSYLYKIQKLYAMTEDAIEANTILNACKYNLINCINEVKELNNNIIDGKCTPTLQQLQALKNYTQDIKNTIKNLKECNGDLTDEINNMANNTPTSIATSVEVLNSNYMQLINHIDTRITYHESALATLEQIKYLLTDTLNTNITDEDVDTLLEDLNTQNTIENTSTHENNVENTDFDTKTTKKGIKNIDTYKNPTFPRHNRNENIDNETNSSDVFDNNNENIDNLNSTTPVVDNSTIKTDTNLVNNNGINNFGYTQNSTGFNNSIITQNNLDNDNGYGGYYYADDGELRNNGINNDNEIGNNGNTLQNNMNRNNNVNTYGYNTMLDALNQGTVNNGINTLELKPNYVNSNVEI